MTGKRTIPRTLSLRLFAIAGLALAVGLGLLLLTLGRSPIAALALVAMVGAGAMPVLSLSAMLRRMRGAFEAASRNEFAVRLDRSPFSEVDAAATSFNAMVGALDETTTRLERLALHDPLTRLPNRTNFMNSFTRAFASAAAADRDLAVMFMDVDRFKVINDSLGHGIGDRLLAVVSRRLVSAAEGAVVARIGGDEFTVLIEGDNAERRAAETADRIHAAFQQPLALGTEEIFTSMSIGIACRTPEDRGITDLLRKSDVALYRAKADGRGRAAIFRPEHDGATNDQFDLDNALRRAVSRGELRLLFQPIIDLADGHIAGAEALLRWEHPHRGVLSPSMFIAVAEETGQIVRIGEWVLQEACSWAARFQRQRPGRPFVMSVNISAAEFRQAGLADRLAAVIDASGVIPSHLKLEVTESVLIGDVEATVGLLSELRGLGVGLSIDDFGTGYSSLSYLQRLPVDTLKIDQSFVRSLAVEASAGPVLRAIADLGNALFMQVVAEGIETHEQMEFVSEIGCRYGQGYYFSKALAPEALELLLESGEPDATGDVKLPRAS